MKTVVTLLSLIRRLEEDDSVLRVEYLTAAEELSELLVEIVQLCDELLITDDGACNWPNIMYLRHYGYRVYAGEQDSFGWLTGCIETRKGIIVYG
jgi:hypothetical protein